MIDLEIIRIINNLPMTRICETIDVIIYDD